MKFKSIILFLFCFLSYMDLSAQNTIPSSVFGNGGSPTSNGSFSINGTMGQPFIGISTGTSENAFIGFWNIINNEITGIDEQDRNDFTEINLVSNYPNPFSSRTTIRYKLTYDTAIRLSIFNVLGEHVTTLVNEIKQAGSYTLEWDASGYDSGTYICRLTFGNRAESKVMQFIR